MFESDDWDLDQDFLNDVDDKSNRDYSQVENQEAQPKRRKVEGFNDDFSSVNDNAANQNMTKCNNKESRKNFILGMFNKNTSEKNQSQNTLSETEECSDNNLLKSIHMQNHGNNQLPRKNLVLGILKKKDIEDKVIENTNNLKLQKVKVGIKSKTNDIQQQEYAIKNNQMKFQCSTKDKQNSSENLRKRLLHNTLKQQSINNAEIKNNLSTSKLPQVQPNEKMTLVRRFPGPAGLLPDNIDDNIPPLLYLNSLEEIEQTKEPADTDLPEYCSQNTKNLFTVGAWQLMLNDVPDGFLEGYEIATIKQIANARKCYSTKVNFLAGIVEHIDHSYENPLIVLKDFSDSIHGIIHRDIPLKYPGLLEPNVVVLLHDVGLLKTSGSFISGKYRILVSPSNLLAIYSNDGQIEHTEYMKSVLESVSNEIQEENEEEEKKKKRFVTKVLEEQSPKCFKHKLEYANNIKEKTNLIKHTTDSSGKSSNFNTNLNKTFDDMNEILDFDFIDDRSFSVSFDTITNSQNEKNFNNSVNKNLEQMDKQSKQQVTKKFSEKEKENVHDDSKQSSENFSENLKQFSSNINAKKKFSHHLKSLQTDVEYHTLQVPARTTGTYLEVEPGILNNTSTRNLDTKIYNIKTSQEEKESEIKGLHEPCQDKVESVRFNTHKERNRLSIRSKLMKFKNTDALTQSQNFESEGSSDQKEDNKTLQDKKLPENQTSSFNMLCNAENDSDDEILSQLDMDTILSNYNDKN